MKKKFRKGISLMMAATMSLMFCMGNVSVKTLFAAEGRKVDVWDFGGVAELNTDLYNNNISPEYWDTSTDISDGGILIAGTTSFGDLAFNHNANDRIYAPLAKRSAGTYNGAKTEYTDGYTANGMWYVNGTGGPTRRYIQVDNVVAGDQVVVYMGSTSGDSTLHFLYMGTDGKVQDDTGSFTTKGNKYAFIAQYSGSYKIYTDASAGKAFFNRVVRSPGVEVSGNIDMGTFTLSDYSLDFTNDTTNIKTQAMVKDGKYNVVLAPGYSYTATISGIVGYGFTNDTKKVAPDITEVMSGKNNVTLKVEEKSTYMYSGQVTGLDSDYDVSKLVITMKPVATSLEEDVILKISSDMTFSATLSPDVEYTAEMAGVNDYYIFSGEVVNDNQPLSQDIGILKKPVYTASGKFLDLPSGSVVSKIEFINEEDSYTYTGTVSENGYSASLRDGAYSVTATVDGYKTNTHLLVKGSTIAKDLLFVLVDKKPAPVAWVSDIYVGYPNKDNNYSTVNDAMKACTGMNIQGEAQRVTVHIAPGTYREQIFVTAPYVSFVNDEPGEVLLTWYYGIGYKYYSADTTGYYNLENAYDQYAKASVAKWGCGTYIKSTAVGFKAKNITFESSFNRYITDEEIEDGVELAGDGAASPIKFERKYGVDVTSRAATERSAALVVEADQTEFENCSFLGGQDTLYTGSANNSSYYKNCIIEGNTDFIFGDGNVVFDGCNIKWKGYSDANPVGGYLTAVRDTATNGYLFRNCTISANTELTVKSGYFGRPWGAGAKVIFLNTKLTDKSLIADAGWTDMSGNTALNANFGEYNTRVADGTKVDTTKRVTGVMDASMADAIEVANYFGSWQPASYTEDSNSVAFEEEPYVTSNGDLNIPYPGNTVTVNYSLGSENDKSDASMIRWYRVDQTTKVKTLVKASTAIAGKSYKITAEDENYNIEVEVSPETFSGQTAEPKIYQILEYVREGYEDPSAGGDITLGDGVNIFLAGDSTVKDYSSAGMYMSGKSLASGSWGEYLQTFFDQEQIKVQNYANGGRSVRSFINEGSLDKIADNIQSGDYLFIQFGHNDSANGAGYLVERFAPLGEPVTDGIYPSTEGKKVPKPAAFVDKYGPTYYAYDSNGTYKWYLQQYIEVAKKAGAIPVLVTPVARQYYTSDGTIKPHHDSTDKTTNTQVTENNAYVTAVKQLAEEQGVHLIDAFALTKDLYEAAYEADPKAAAGKSEYGPQVMGEGDSTHSNKLGGFISGALMAKEIQALNINISSAVKLPAQVLGQTPENTTVFSVNGKSQLTASSAPYWQEIGQSLINDIGNYSAPPTGPKPTLWIIGDSTVSSFNDDYYYPRYGWGTQIESYLDGTFDVQNIALSGRSSKSYMADPQYQTLLKGMKSGDYLLIGFGHNDEKAEEERYTNPNGTYQDQGSFSNSLYENYIKQAEAVGCQVVLSTPIVRRTETGNWSDSNLHKTTTSGSYPGGDYAQAIKDLGAALTIPVVDMTTLTKELYDQLGIAETINLHAWTSSKSSSVDNTHTNIWGAKYNAYLITKTIKELNVNDLAKHIKSENAPQKDSTLVKNPNYTEGSYSNDLAESSLWEDIGDWKGSVFGDLGGNPSIANQILEQDGDGNMHIAVKNDKGKIAGTSDGIAMYYYKVPANSTFSLSAKARINSFDVNDQVSFGLMARDDMYIDTNSKALMGDYVAAGPLKLAKGPVWNSFARKSGVLTQGGTAVNAIKAGDTVDLNITGTSDGYSCKFGDEETITGGFDFKLTKVDADYVYVGMFVARNADITFSDIKLVLGEEEVETEDKNDLVAEDWTTLKLGTQSDGMATPEYDATNKTITLNTGEKGKMANTGQSGFSMYAKKINSQDYNFSMRGTFKVKDLKKADNQSSFGLMVLDSNGANNTASDYLNQIDISAALKNEATRTCIPTVRTLMGYSDETGQTNAGGKTDVTRYFDVDAEVFSSQNATTLSYNFEMIKDSNGYICNWYNDDWSSLINSIRIYNPNNMLLQDSENIYVGFYASRIGTVEVSNISYEQHTPTTAEINSIDKSKWFEYDDVKIKTFNGETAAEEDYTYRFSSNVTGTVTISDDQGFTYIDQQEIKNGDTIKFNISDYGEKLRLGTNTFYATVTPFENSCDSNGDRAYSDRLLLLDYSPVVETNTVTYSNKFADMSTIYVSAQGSSHADGTEGNPVDIYTATSYAMAGQQIILMNGTYNLNSVVSIPYSVSGTSSKPINMMAEETGKVIFDGSGIPSNSDSVVFLKGDYWNIYGINICNASDGVKGMHVSGNNNKIERCEFYRNGSTGLQISYSGGEPKVWWPWGNTIKACTSYYNCDSKQNDADGFAAKLSVGSGNVFDSCIAYNNADDGYDLYAKDTTGYGPIEAVTIKNSLAYSNGILEDGAYSKASGNGFKLGGEGLTGKHVLENSISYNNGGTGITSNNGPDCRVYNSTSVDNGLFSRVGATDSRNNYQLTPKNGASYPGTTAYIIENSISYYTDLIQDYGTMVADKFTLINQDDGGIYTENNYLCRTIGSESVNSENVGVNENWFVETDYTSIAPTRNSDGSIDMHGLFVLTEHAPIGIGASVSKTTTLPQTSVQRPTASLAAGAYTTSQSIELSTITEGATIHYTTNGDNPTRSSKQYDESITVNKTTTIKAMAVKDGMEDSDIAVFEYFINDPSVLEVMVSPAKTSVQKGRTKQFKADLVVLYDADQSVTWAVTGGSDSTISTNGLLEVGPDETAKKLTIIAISDFDNSKEGTAEVTVTETEVTYHTVAISALPKEGGTVSGGGEVAKGGTANIHAKANDGYLFAKWIDNDSYDEYTTSASISLKIESDRDFTAVFEPVVIENYRITASAGRGGTISPEGDVNVKERDNKTFTIKPNSGYYISDVIVDGKSIGAKNEYTFSDVIQDHTIKATFNRYPAEDEEEDNSNDNKEDSNDKGNTGTQEPVTPPNPDPIPAPELINVEEITKSIDAAIISGKAATISIPKNGGTFEISKEISNKLKNSKKDLVIKGVGTQLTLTSDVLGQLSDTILSVSVSNLVEASYNQVKTAVAKEKNTSLIGDATLTTELIFKSDGKPVESLAERLVIEIDLSNQLEQIKDTSKLTVARVIEVDGKTQIIKIGGEYNKDTKTFKAYSDQVGKYILLECDNIKKINLAIGEHVSTINGIAKTNDVAPVIINDTTMMPLRFITENLGGTIAWDEKTQAITLNIDGTQLKMQVGIKVEGYDISPVIQNGRTLVPLRYISETIGANVTWISKTKAIEIVR